MCGIVGYLCRTGSSRPLGDVVVRMLQALGCRGPDSAGVALWSEASGDKAAAAPPAAPWKLWVKLAEHNAVESAAGIEPTAHRVLDAAGREGSTLDSVIRGAYLRLLVHTTASPDQLSQALESAVPGVEVVSLGRQMEVVKQVGSPEALARTYALRTFAGTHGIGHTRLSTESRVDLSHSQPFWAHGLPDVASVHNGHITNYHKLRRQYEQRGYRFYTENDSEIIGVYLHDQLSRLDRPLEEALERSVSDFDGSFSYLVGTGNTLALVKDRFGFKPLVVAETDDFVALATEEIALCGALGRGFSACEAAPGTVKLWPVPLPAPLEVLPVAS